MYCRSCGTELPDNSKFCNVCGASTTDMPQKSPNALSDNNEKESALAVLKSLFEYFNQKRGAYDRLGYLLTHKTENAGVIIMVILDCILALPMLILLKYDFIRGFILFALLALVVVTIIVVMKYDKNKKSDYNELVSINNMLNQYYNDCPIKPIPIGKDFSNPRIIASLIKTVTDGRADTIKESLKIFNEDLHNGRMENYAYSTAVSSRRTASAATVSAFYNAASFFLK